MATKKQTTNNKAEETANPLGEEVAVEVAMPKTFKIKMVEASNLTDFKIWGVISSLMANLLVGFFVAAITNTVPERQSLLCWVTSIFGLIVIGSIAMTWRANSKMSTQETIINMKASR